MCYSVKLLWTIFFSTIKIQIIFIFIAKRKKFLFSDTKKLLNNENICFKVTLKFTKNLKKKKLE